MPETGGTGSGRTAAVGGWWRSTHTSSLAAIAWLLGSSIASTQDAIVPPTEDFGNAPAAPEAPAVIPAIIPFMAAPEPAIIPFTGPPATDATSPPSAGMPAAGPMVQDSGSPPVAALTEPAAAATIRSSAELADVGGWNLASPQMPTLGAATPSASGAFASSPSGFENGWNPFSGSTLLDESFIDGLTLSGVLSGTYDSNPYRGYSPTDETGESSDYFLTLGGMLGYHTRASTWTYGVDYTGSYSQYFKQTELSGYNQQAGATMKYDGGPLNATLRAGIDFGSGANRYYAAVVDEIRYHWGLSASYRISPKTSLTGDASQQFTSASGNSSQDTESTNFNLAALWHYSKLTEFGPGIRYTMRSGSYGDDRRSIGPTITVNYHLSRKISLNSRIGTDFAEYGDGSTADPSLYTSINLNYRASALWGMDLSLLRDAQASYSDAGQFEELTALRLGYHRKIRRAVWNLGMSLETRTTENSDSAGNSDQPDRDYLSFDTSLGMPVFSNTTAASVFFRYIQQDESASESWDSIQLGFGMSRSF